MDEYENRVVIPLGGGLKLVAERNADPYYHRELFIGIEDKAGRYIQDIACVRNTYSYSAVGGELEWNDREIEVLVWSDGDDEDYTHKIPVFLRSEEET